MFVQIARHSNRVKDSQSVIQGFKKGGILTYSGWKRVDGDTKDPLKLNPLSDCIGMVNTYAAEMNGQTNHLNNRLDCKGDTCELSLGDGTKRLYEKIESPPSELLGEELLPTVASKIENPYYFRLVSEALPSGNIMHYSYNADGHLASVEIHNALGDNVHSWMQFTYQFHPKGCHVEITSSDEKKLIYAFEKTQIDGKTHLALKKVLGSHSLPVSYHYQIHDSHHLLTQKILPEDRLLEIDYDNQARVKTLKSPDAQSGKPTLLYGFSYGDTFTDVVNAAGIKTRYLYDNRLQLIAIERYDQKSQLYRADQKYYGQTKKDATLLVARSVADSKGHVLSYRSFKYDSNGNVLEERLCGNLTGKKDVSLQVDAKGKLLNPDEEECHVKKFTYSEDGFNLLTSLGDSKGNRTTYHYEEKSNRLCRKLIYEGIRIKKREFRFYNDDAICIQIFEDNNSHEDPEKIDGYGGNERHIKEIHPKRNLPGVGLPEIIEESALDISTKKQISIKKLVNTYSPQGDLLSCATYDADSNYAYSVSKTFNHLGQVTSETDPEGKIISYSYDKIGNQILASVPHEQKTVETRYDFRNNPFQIIEIADHLQAVQQYSYDALDRKISSTDRFGNTTHYEYDDFGHLTRLIHPTVLDEYAKPIQPTFSYTYDIFGNVLTTTDSKGYVTQKIYNLRGDPTKIFYPDGSFELFKYDPEGSLHQSKSRNSILTVYAYDYLGRIIRKELSIQEAKGVEHYFNTHLYNYSAFRLLEEKDDDATTQLKYDPAGRVIEIFKYANGRINAVHESRKTEIVYDSLGRESKKKTWFDIGDADYSLECIEYDLLGNVLQKWTEDADGNIYLLTNFTYDDAGRCVEECSGQTLLKTVYDPFGEPIAYLDALGNETKIIIDYEQDKLIKTIINPLGVQTIIQFDALGRIVSTVKKDSKKNPLSSEKILYDALGNKSVAIHANIIDGKQIGTQKTRWVYGPMNRLDQLIEAENSPEEKTTVYTYDDLGRLESKLLPGTENPLYYTYGKKGQVSKIACVAGKKTLLSHSFSHDRKGNITSASTHGGQKVGRTYNIFSQVIEENVEDGEGKYTLKFQYDRKGRLKSITLPDQSSINYVYDAIFGREIIRTSSNGEELYTHTYNVYNPEGKLTNETLIGYCGDRKTHYDACSRKISVTTDYHSETVPKGGYSSLGLLLSVQRQGEFPLENGSYTYNTLSKLISENNGVHKTHSYDSLDNRLSENQEQLFYNTLNQLITKANTEYTYDPQGNLLRKSLDGEETHFESNLMSELISIKKPDESSLQFTYDPFGRRLIKKPSQGSISRSFYLGHHELGILTKTGSVQKLRIPGIPGDAISLKSVAIEIHDQAYAVLHDLSGNVCALLDPDAREIVESYTYTAFGQEKIYNAFQELTDVSDIGNLWRYAEKPIDEETGLIYFGLRYYDPEIGRWISQDPQGYIEGPNLYAYCNNDPLNTFDQFGLSSTRDPSFLFHWGVPKGYDRTSGGDLDKTVSAYLPKVTYCNTFEQMYPNYERSKVFSLGLKETKDIGIGFINGIWNDFDGAYQSALHISELTDGYNIHAVYNATHGRCSDLKECKMGLKYIATEPVIQLHTMWNSFFEKSSIDAKFLMVCHSQGVIHVRNALLDYPLALRERIIVVAIAPAAYIYQATCAQVVHIRNESLIRDFVPRFDTDGAKRSQETIVDVRSHPDADTFDHALISPTYRSELYLRLNNFIESGGRKI
ncbi:MAG: hypothetical protein S4CHLAM2_18720 [Chlamydiales bacterium]|nr:hypothetical protein [Chlamydiales bacterium]